MLARRFLYLIAILIALVLVAGIAWNLMQDRLIRLAFVPEAAFTPLPDTTAPDYSRPEAWFARPGLADDPSRWRPAGIAPVGNPPAAVFYIHPTTYLSRDRWNGPLDDAPSNGRLRLFTQSQASALAGSGAVWAPRYRQATLGAFLAGDDPRARSALDFAYADLARAFAAFVAAQPADRPIVLAGHSQGALHLLRLLREHVAGRPLARRIVATYAIGWPISITADLPALGFPACARPDQSSCLVAWQSFAEPADPHLLLDYFKATRGPTGLPRAGTNMVCVNPLTGTAGGQAGAAANRGALVPEVGLGNATLVPGGVPARCSPEGLLLIGPPPRGFSTYVLPGNNYHVFDYALFWANVRADVARRLAGYEGR
jgi:hypothetical protein